MDARASKGFGGGTDGVGWKRAEAFASFQASMPRAATGHRHWTRSPRQPTYQS
jgi:hypothetical protein